MAFNRAHSFSINVRGDFNQVDNSGRGIEMQVLVNAACPSASYQSAERADPPRCHPDTRREVINQIMDWVNSSDLEKRIMWLSAPAGAGKSSIAQTIAEMCSRDGKLLSSFFFSRTAGGSGRDDGNRLFPTIAYHLAVSVPDAKDFIMSELQRDPALFQHSMDVQLKTLVMDPIIHLRNSRRDHIPFVVIIDGLDECDGIPVQSRIVSTIARSITDTSSSVRFLFASRPERDIQKAFDKPAVENATIRLTLEENEQAYHDIEVYLNSEFYNIKNAHILANELINDHEWPSNQDIWTLMIRSSGHFIYASTVMNYIANDEQDPREALSAIIHRPTTIALEDAPFAELDALYIHILLSAASRTRGGYNALLPILQVLALAADKNILSSTRLCAEFLGISESIFKMRVMHLYSIIHIPRSFTTYEREISPSESESDSEMGGGYYSRMSTMIKFHHASFKDFLLDSSRSENFFVDPVDGHVFMGTRCLAILQSTDLHILNSGTMYSDGWIDPKTDPNAVFADKDDRRQPRIDPKAGYAAKFFFIHLEHSKFNVNLLNEFLRTVDAKSMVSVILNKTSLGNLTQELLSSIYYIDFDRVDDFAVPKSVETVEICQRVSNALDEMVLNTFTDTPVLETYAKIISRGTGIPNSFIYRWAVKIMDIPERGKHIYITDENAKYLILSILNTPAKHDVEPDDILHQYYGSLLPKTVLKIEQESWPSALQYLFQRINPSQEFGSKIREHLAHVNWLLNIDFELQSSYQKSVYSVLEKCGLSKEISKMRRANDERIRKKVRSPFSVWTDTSESEYEFESE